VKSDVIKRGFLKPESLVKVDVILESGIIELDSLLGGFKAAEITYIDGDSTLIATIPNQLCVNTYRTFNSSTIYLDGGICADPYEIARYAREMELNERKVLENIHISRAFTVYQLATFIDKILENEIIKHEPRTLIVGKFPSLFFDQDVPFQESQTILQNTLERLQDLTADYNLITVLTNRQSRLYSNKVRSIIQKQASETVKMKYIEPCTYVDLLQKQKSATILHMAKGQMRLEHFGLVS